MAAILVTGGAGFIGSHFVRQWLAENEGKIVNLDKLTYAGNLDSLSAVADDPNHVFVQGDIGDAEVVSNLLREHRPSAIINFAAESHVDRSIDGAAEFVSTNVVGTSQLLETTLDHFKGLDPDEQAAFRFVHISTDEVFGSLGAEGKFTEESAYAPNSPYAASKAASDHFVRAFHQTHDLPAIISNCSNNYGPYQFPEKLIPTIILNAVEGKPLPVYGDGQNVRDWLHVDDHCRAIRRVMERGVPGETYNIGGNCERSNLAVVEEICRVVDRLRPSDALGSRSSLIQFVTDRPGHDRRYAVDTGKIERELDWRPHIEFETGLEQTVAWYLENSDWLAGVTSGNYRRQRLGLG